MILSNWVSCRLNNKFLLDYLDTHHMNTLTDRLRYRFIYKIFNSNSTKKVFNKNNVEFRLFLFRKEEKKNAYISFMYKAENGLHKELKFGITFTTALYLRRRAYEPPTTTHKKDEKKSDTSDSNCAA